ncbi:growth/differentiation factor 2 [Genypterus blacodes]|uniref:growth/differentiation factor 2 n=1 Tax=Genypterus blacodes TaxID=154954 RepID=UPI003F774297
MQSCKTFLFQMCVSLVVSTASYSCKPLGNQVQSRDAQRLHQRRSEQEVLDEEDADSRLENFLGTMKEGFLRKLNLSDVPQEHGKIDPPQFMMELYNKYASDSTAIPQSDVIRSFTVQDISQAQVNGTKRRHRLTFNVSIPNHEKITAAELRLLFLPDAASPAVTGGVKATVKVYQVEQEQLKPTAQLLLGKEVTGSQSMWETFDVTRAVQSWIRLGQGAQGLDLLVDQRACGSAGGGGGGAGCLDMSLSVGDNTSAALIVFSDDLGSRKKETKKELREMILHEEETILQSGTDSIKEDQFPNEIPEALHPRRRKRKAEREYCRRTSLKVNFKDIGWDSWIVAPPEYDAFECRGLCYHPLTDESTPSKHALIQTLMNIRNPKAANMACCVPIKLDPITVMYQENGRLTIRYLYEEMKVAECGCR